MKGRAAFAITRLGQGSSRVFDSSYLLTLNRRFPMNKFAFATVVVAATLSSAAVLAQSL